MRRRIGDYDPALGFDPYHFAMTVAAFLMAASVLIFFINVIISVRKGKEATGNIWESRSPEWLAPSPMPVHNFDRELEVVGEPYDYGLPDSVYVRYVDEKKEQA